MNTMVLSAGVFHKSDTDDEFYKYFESEFNKIIRPIVYLSTSKKCVQILYHAIGRVNNYKIVGNNITILPYNMRNIPCTNKWLKHTSTLIIENRFLLYRIPYYRDCAINRTQLVVFTTLKFLEKSPPIFFGTPRMDELNNIIVNFDDDLRFFHYCPQCGAVNAYGSSNICAQCIQISKNTVIISPQMRYDIFKFNCGFLYSPLYEHYSYLFCQIGIDCTDIIIQITNKYRHVLTLIPYLVL